MPEVDKDKCTNCGACEAVCPVLSLESLKPFNQAPLFNAAWSLDDDIRKHSSSGGAFTHLANVILEQNGFVCGAAVDGTSVKHIIIDNKQDLSRLRGSKYLQSNTAGIYSDVLSLLKQDKPVLFVGTPCQVAGLRLLAERQKVDAKLYTCDLLCHGVPSRKFFDLCLEHESKKVSRLDGFRNKRVSWKKGFSLDLTYADGTSKEIPVNRSVFYSSFAEGLCLQRRCYDCPFAKLPRVGDVTLGDFWGNYKSKDQLQKGVSLVIANSEKGVALLNECKDMEHHRADILDALPGNPRIYSGRYTIGGSYLRRLFPWALSHLPFGVLSFLYGGSVRHRIVGKIPYKVFIAPFFKRKKRKFKEKAFADFISSPYARSLTRRVNILTFHCAKSYGAVLQSYALQQILRTCGYDPEFINLRPERIEKDTSDSNVFRQFENMYLDVNPAPHRKPGRLSAKLPLGDAFVVGSDQVWNPKIVKKFIFEYFLKFAPKDSRKIAYAASYGELSPEWGRYRKYIPKMLSEFSVIGVREKSGVAISADMGRHDAVQVLDPTLLVDSSEYEKLIVGTDVKMPPKVVAGFFLGKDTLRMQAFEKAAENLHGQPVLLDAKNEIYAENYGHFVPSVGNWLNTIKNSSFVITDSYHGMLFSIIFQRQFAILPAKEKRFVRIAEFLESLNLESRVCRDFSELYERDWSAEPIDYAPVVMEINRRKEESIAFLKAALAMDIPTV